jgi:GTP-binding protein
MTKPAPRVAIVGRPNVGKSTLFNRITGKRKAIVHETPGVTRDVQRMLTEWNGKPFELIDTGGLFSGIDDPLVKQVEEKALAEALACDAIILVVDAVAGLSPIDFEIAREVRLADKPVFLAVNKAEGREGSGNEFFALGLGSIYEISSAHGHGIGELLDDLVSALPKRSFLTESLEFKVAVVGRPNVGKSSLVNALLGKNVNIVDERPGTTRDSIDIKLRWHGNEIMLVDTAGIKRRSRTKDAVSAVTAIKSMESIARADIALLLLDASRGIANQDIKVGSYAHNEGKGIVIGINKWDLVEKDDKTASNFEAEIRRAFAFIAYAPLIFISALTGQRVSKILPLLLEVKSAREKRVSTGELNRFIERIVSSHPPPFHAGGNGKIFYVTQIGVAPPRFSIFVNNPSFFDRSYIRFLNNRLREEYSFPGTRLIINLIGKKGRKS